MRLKVQIKYLIFAALFFSNVSLAGTTMKFVKYQLWYEGISEQSKQVIKNRENEKLNKKEMAKAGSEASFVEELSRPMHLVLKKHHIQLNQ